MSCVECGRPVRPRGSTLNEHPGTLAMLGLGRCARCYRRAQRAGVSGGRARAALDLLPATPDGHALAAWRDDRRRRGVPVEGHRP